MEKNKSTQVYFLHFSNWKKTTFLLSHKQFEETDPEKYVDIGYNNGKPLKEDMLNGSITILLHRVKRKA